jgi:hypothetical protein
MGRAQIGLSLLLFAVACGPNGNANSGASAPTPPAANPPAAQPTAQAPPAAPAAPTPPAAPLSDKVDDPSFELAARPAGPYAAGKLSSFAISLTPRGKYHVNQDYPLSVSLHAEEGLALPKAELAKADAATFGEKLAKFDVPFTAAKAGTHRVEAKVRFAVCTPENCVPDERTLALNLPVQ